MKWLKRKEKIHEGGDDDNPGRAMESKEEGSDNANAANIKVQKQNMKEETTHEITHGKNKEEKSIGQKPDAVELDDSDDKSRSIKFRVKNVFRQSKPQNTVEEDDEDEEEQEHMKGFSGIYGCPGSHELEWCDSIDHGCEVCGELIPSGHQMLSCRECNFDLHQNCRKPPRDNRRQRIRRQTHFSQLWYQKGTQYPLMWFESARGTNRIMKIWPWQITPRKLQRQGSFDRLLKAKLPQDYGMDFVDRGSGYTQSCAEEKRERSEVARRKARKRKEMQEYLAEQKKKALAAEMGHFHDSRISEDGLLDDGDAT